MRKAELLRQHRSKAEVEADIAEGFRSGRFRPPPRISVAYALAKKGSSPTADGGIIGSTPQVRVYAPYVQNADVGTLPEGEEGAVERLPTVVHGGSPDAYIVVNVRSDIGDRASVAPR
jgi:hypothetical protein